MVYEFEGRTEKEAIDRAAEELGLEKDDFDVEILETHRQGLFKKGFVRIRIHTESTVKSTAVPAAKSGGPEKERGERPISKAVFGDPEPKNEFEQKITSFMAGLIERMGYTCKVSVLFRDNHKLGLKIESDHSSILIGKKGKNLDALQLLLNIYAGRLGKEEIGRAHV
jgi:spoIIIJ-associated protein